MLSRVGFAAFALIGVAVVGGGAGACSSSDAIASGGGDLVGGQVAPQGAFASTVRIVGGCAATRIGERLILTAAHCVRAADGQIRPEYQAQGSLHLRTRGGPPIERWLVITRTVLHPQVEHLCRSMACGGPASAAERDAPDVAVIEVDEALDGIPVAEIDVEAPRVDDEVTVVGFGCAEGTAGDTLHFLDTRVVAGASTGDAEAGTADEDGGAGSNYVVTSAPTVVPTSTHAPADSGASPAGSPECSGDLGGALFRKGTSRVIGVNAGFTFPTSGAGPITGWHARVDGASRWGVAAWLAEMGARLSAPCDAGACVPPSTSAARTDAGADASADAGDDAAP